MKDSTQINPDERGDISSFSPQTQQLHRVLSEKSELLARMLHGAWIAISNTRNPESLVQAAHSIRELMEKAPIEIPEVPVQQGSGNLTDEVRALQSAWQQIKNSKWTESPPWIGEIDSTLSGWLSKADDFFNSFNENHKTRTEQLVDALSSLDQAGNPLPPALVKEKVEEWKKLRQYFLSIAHHGRTGEYDEFTNNISDLEVFLLNLLYPQPIKDIDELDALISEGESK